jgi:hypothetical protein
MSADCISAGRMSCFVILGVSYHRLRKGCVCAATNIGTEKSAMQTAFLADQDRNPVTGLFMPGNNARRLKRFRIEAMMRDIADTEFEGGFIGLKPSDRIALEKACTLLCGHPKRHDVEVRAINSAARLLAGLRKRIKPKKQPNARRGPSMASLLAKRADNP